MAGASNANFLPPLIGLIAQMQASGAKIDTNGFDITIAHPLTHDPALGAAPDGGVTKLGAGTLTLEGTQEYSSLTTTDGITNLQSSLANATITNDGGTLNVNADATNSMINANGGTVNLTANQTLAGLNIGANAVVVVTAPPPPADGGIDAPVFAEGPVQAVPEPGTVSLALLGILSLVRRRR
ncbi:MAG TPA: PEP-CTERM sorting domain-containing protein [Chthoniobacteraceae bacterium]|nr:PEP-CTERM sorting domain-containing protein [Chthoniobacteraceae bacterium]